MNELTYSIAIATRNRPDALRLSIPRMIEQSRRPSQIVIVDSSDNHEEIKQLVNTILQYSAIPFTLIQSEKGLTKQRNRALDLVEHPIVFFPDDDSIWFPNLAESKMIVYEKDTNNSIVAVCAYEAMQPPVDFIKNASDSYALRNEDKWNKRLAKYRYRLENKFVPDPAKILGKSFYDKFTETEWTESLNVHPVEWMTGFRMSFRTEEIKTVRFSEEFSDYSLFEDIDASFGVWKLGSVVAIKAAKVYHHKSPERRGNGERLGIEQLINKAYVVAKHSPLGHPCRKLMSRFAKYKTFQYWISSRTDFGKSRLRGAKKALSLLPQIINASPTDADQVYRRIVSQLNS